MTQYELTEAITKTLRKRDGVLTRLEAEVLARDIVDDLRDRFGPIEDWNQYDGD